MSRQGNNLRRRPKRSLSTESRAYGYIQENTPVSDGEGGSVDSWVNINTNAHSMALISVSAQQVIEYKTVNVEASHLIKIRGEIVVSELNRIVIGSRIFEILDIEDIQERGIVNWIECKERRE